MALETLTDDFDIDDLQEELGDSAAPSYSPKSSGALATVFNDALDIQGTNKRALELDEAIGKLLSMQQQRAAEKYSGPTNADKLKIAAAFFAPTRTGAFSENLGGALSAMGEGYQKGQDRDYEEEGSAVKTAFDAASLQDERQRLRQEQKLKYAEKFAKQGLRMNKDGSIVADPSLAPAGKAVRNLSADEIKSLGMRPGTVAQIDGNGKIKVLQQPTATQSVIVGYDDQNRPIYSDSGAPLTPKVRAQLEGNLQASQTLLPEIDSILKQIDSGEIDETAFGLPAVGAAAYDKTIGQMTGVISPTNKKFREKLAQLQEQLPRIFAADPTNPSNKDRTRVDELLVSMGPFQSLEDAKIKLQTMRDTIEDRRSIVSVQLGKGAEQLKAASGGHDPEAKDRNIPRLSSRSEIEKLESGAEFWYAPEGQAPRKMKKK